MSNILMECGCIGSAVTVPDNIPICPIHSCMVPAVPQPDLTGRKAQCSYGSHGTVDSTFHLAFFVYRGPESPSATQWGKCCGLYKPHCKCKEFIPRGSFEYDEYYCGCYGWD